MAGLQSTDAENSKAPYTATNVGKAKSSSLGSSQAQALRSTSGQNVTNGGGSGGENPGAPVPGSI